MKQIAELAVRMACENPRWGYTRIQGALANLGHRVARTVEVWGLRGLVTFYVLIVIELSSRRVHFAGATTSPDTAWMIQIGRNLTGSFDGFLQDKRFVIMDRDRKHCETFRVLLGDAGIEPVRLPPRSPNLNAHCERCVRSIKEECLDRMIFFGEQSLRRAVGEYLAHYHAERNHQGRAVQILGRTESWEE